MTDLLTYDVVVIGGGPAGTTTALYTTRLGHRTAVFEREGGRHSMVDGVHNLYGVSERVSGAELSAHAIDQLDEYGGDYHLDPVIDVRRSEERDGEGSSEGGSGGSDAGAGDESAEKSTTDAADDATDADATPDARFVVEATHATVGAERVVFATGFSDVEPAIPELQRFAGRGLHYCLHCDAYTLGDGSVFVLGHDEHAAEVAMLLLNVTAEVDLLLNGEAPTWDEETERQLAAHPVERVDKAVDGAFPEDGGRRASGSSGGRRGGGTAPGSGGQRSGDGRTGDVEPWLGGLRFVDDTERRYLGGFAMYGKEYNADLAADLGCALTEDGAVDVDEQGRTSVDGAYAVGDVTHGQNQTTIALADGARAGIAIHKDLRRFPLPADEAEALDDSDVPAAPADVRARMRSMRERDARAGLREPSPRQ